MRKLCVALAAALALVVLGSSSSQANTCATAPATPSASSSHTERTQTNGYHTEIDLSSFSFSEKHDNLKVKIDDNCRLDGTYRIPITGFTSQQNYLVVISSVGGDYTTKWSGKNDKDGVTSGLPLSCTTFYPGEYVATVTDFVSGMWVSFAFKSVPNV